MPWGHNRGIKDMHSAIGRIGEPKFPFIRGKADAVTGATVTFLLARFASRDFNAGEHFTGSQIPYFKTQQTVDVYETKGLVAIDGERPNHVTERPDGLAHSVSGGIHHAQYG